MDAEMTTPKAIPAMVTIIIEPEKLSRMLASFYPRCVTAKASPNLEPARW
jgi:hypothetical protein